ncbi:MAG TPA: hypothetical protein VGL23_08005 [Chloroflexota bacterium]
MTPDFDPPMTPDELRASLAAFELRWPFPEDGWTIGRSEIRPDRDSYDEARRAVAAGRRDVSIAGSVTMEIGGQRRGGAGAIRLLLRPDSFPPRERWVMAGGRWAI